MKHKYWIHAGTGLIMAVTKWRAKDAKGKRMVHVMPFDAKIEWENPAKYYIKDFLEIYKPANEQVIEVLYGRKTPAPDPATGSSRPRN